MASRLPFLSIVALVVAACATPAPAATSSVAPTAPLATAAPPTASPATTDAPSATPPAGSSGLPEDTMAPSPTMPAIGIIAVECLAGQTVRLHVSITADVGIPTYALWSTWGGGGDTTRSFPAPYPTHIDELVEFTHAIVDPEPGRVHQFGLAVTLVGATEPILTYAIEPGTRCPGH